MTLSREVRDLGVREVVPRSEFPNFRDHGMQIEPPLLRLLENLQKNFGRAFVAESGLRQMLCENVGHMAGVDSIPQALERLEHRGLVAQEWLVAGGIKPDGEPCGKGMRLIVVARNRHQRFAFAARAKHRNRRRGVTNRVDTRTVAQALGVIAQSVKEQPPQEREQEAERKRDQSLQWLREQMERGPPD